MSREQLSLFGRLMGWEKFYLEQWWVENTIIWGEWWRKGTQFKGLERKESWRLRFLDDRDVHFEQLTMWSRSQKKTEKYAITGRLLRWNATYRINLKEDQGLFPQRDERRTQKNARNCGQMEICALHGYLFSVLDVSSTFY